MKNSHPLYKKTLWVSLAVLLPAAVAFGQAQPQSSQASQQSAPPPAQPQPDQKKTDPAADAAKKPEKEKPKPKKVYTEEDLSSLRGNGVSVVGDGNSGATGASGGTRQSDGKAKPGVVPMSGQDEDYWRGKARAILDAIASTDQEIAKTKDELKKYGNDGFDAQSGLKDNIIYIDSRGGKLQQLEKRKADLEKKLDDLQEEGRKAGAEPSWFR
jgi:hypothetical protein